MLGSVQFCLSKPKKCGDTDVVRGNLSRYCESPRKLNVLKVNKNSVFLLFCGISF